MTTALKEQKTNTYRFSRLNEVKGTYEYRTVQAKSYEEADYMLRLTGFRLFSITKGTGYKALPINERINAKGNAGLLYTTYNNSYLKRYAHMHDEKLKVRLILGRIAKANPKYFTPSMLLNKNTVRV